MEKKPRKRKPLNVKLDTKNVDVEITRDENGNVKVDVDTPKIDAHFTKDQTGVKLTVEVNDNEFYEFESNGKSPKLPKGIWKITGEMVKNFVAKGLGNLKK
jgi:hypothetical protein